VTENARLISAVEASLRSGIDGTLPRLDYGDLVRWNALTRGSATAVVIGDAELTFGELARRAFAAGKQLTRSGLGPGQRVALLGANSAEWIVYALGVLAMGGTIVPLNARYTDVELDQVLALADPSVLMVQERYGRRDLSGYVNHLRHERPSLQVLELDGRARSSLAADSRPEATGTEETGKAAAVGRWADDPGVILFTSGSTAAPKGCLLTHSGMIRNACQHSERLGITSEDRWFSPMPLFHGGGFIWGLTSILVTGATLISQPVFDAGSALALIEETKATYHHGVDTMFIAEIDHPRFHSRRVASLRVINSTGPPPLLERISRATRVEGVLSKWGISEGYGNLTLPAPTDPYEKRITTVGRKYKGIEYRIDSPQQDGVGEILIRGSVMEGYFRATEATADMIDSDGWLHTGDLGLFDDGGYLHYSGRIKQMLKVGGENVSALEIESLLLSDPSVAIACVVGLPDPLRGEAAIAVVQTDGRGSASEAGLVELCRERLAKFKRPSRILVLGPGEMPLTASGKPDRPLVTKLAREAGS
jgi:acyl-CoA synthetase (AMP-forming)/AMP-acid ligase II